MNSLIKAQQLSIGYKEAVLQSEINFQLNEGDILIVKGPNGSGKSTLIKTLLKQIPPITGNILLSPSLKIEHLPQLISYDFPVSITLGEIIKSFNLNQSEFSMFDDHFFNKKWSDASGGEKQKTLILCRIGNNSDVLFLDEPFNHVDNKSIDELSEFITNLLKLGRVKAIVMISHIIPQFDKKVSLKEVYFND